jgi:hypothetical protein
MHSEKTSAEKKWKHWRNLKSSLVELFTKISRTGDVNQGSINFFILLSHSSEVGLLDKSSSLARALGLTKVKNMRVMILVSYVVATQVRLTCLTNQILLSFISAFRWDGPQLI